MSNYKTYWHGNYILNNFQDAFGKMVVRRSDLPQKDILVENSDAEALYLLAGASLSATSKSHSCLNLEEWIAEQSKQTPSIQKRLDNWKNKCLQLKTNAMAILEGNDGTFTPERLIVLRTDAPQRAYLNRFYLYEKNVGSRIKEFCSPTTAQIPEETAHQVTQTNFHPKDPSQTNAILNSLRHDFSIITGGPGRGKTTVLTELLAFHMKHFWTTNQRPMRIAICAPTGKAAARMKESIEKALRALTQEGRKLFSGIIEPLGQLRPQTVHKLLGIKPDSDYPQKNSADLLDFDLVAIDECSMMSLELFYDLLMALPKTTKLILLGDENQLQSVEEGKVLAELCKNLFTAGVVNRLTENHRSKENEPLSAYTDEIITGNADVEYLYSDHDPVASQGIFQGYELPTPKELEGKIKEFLTKIGILDKEGNSTWTTPASPEEALANQESFKILTAVRDGHYGVAGLNTLMRDILGLQKTYADGVPILVTKNDDVTNLRNGDIGVCFNDRIYFRALDATGQDAIKSFAPIQLPPHECAFAMTIHKSQGSDYTSVLMVLPEKDMPLLTRELVYTGMTRTKKNFALLAKKEILVTAQTRQTIRWSALDKWL